MARRVRNHLPPLRSFGLGWSARDRRVKTRRNQMSPLRGWLLTPRSNSRGATASD
ncbi:hypothetical protein RISK_006291 [Rhodopirellula islandica]|uniref:Uncharacterized protein n=1 Tax=Rhodopirellula islandica TaxID=595434 RepID=A0A0J1B589_RHOIS|nr:hypothetical protein RISK_006291 [Rhodopirellula islandica]